MKMLEIEVGSAARCKTKEGSFLKSEESHKIFYCGMPTEKSFSLGLVTSESISSLNVLNFYYPLNTKDINVRGHVYKVNQVTPEKIILQYLGQPDNER